MVHLFPLIIDPSLWEISGYELSWPFLLTDVTVIRFLTFVHTYRRLLVQDVVLTTSPTRRKGAWRTTYLCVFWLVKVLSAYEAFEIHSVMCLKVLKAFEKQLCLLVKVEYLLKFTSIFFFSILFVKNLQKISNFFSK